MKLITLALLAIVTLTSCGPNDMDTCIYLQRQLPLGCHMEIAVDDGFVSWLVIDPSPDGKIAIVTNISNSDFFRVTRLCQTRTSDPVYVERNKIGEWFNEKTEK